MAYMFFAVFMCMPLVILGVNLGKSAMGTIRNARSGAPAASRRPRGKVSWPVRARAPQAVRRSPLTVLRRRRGSAASTPVVAAPVMEKPVTAAPQAVATRPVPVRTAADPSLLAAASAPQPLVAEPRPAAPLPVTASTYGWVPAPPSAFEAGPALKPRKGADVIAFPDRFDVRELAEAR